MAKSKKNQQKVKGAALTYLIGREELHWADLVSVKFAEEKFLLTFSQFHPYKNSYTVVSEIILPPKVAASLAAILAESVMNYKKSFLIKKAAQKKTLKK